MEANFLYLLRLFLKRNRFVATAAGPPLNTVEASTLNLCGQMTLTFKEVAEYQQLPTSTCNQVLSRLIDGGFLTSKISANDRRSKILQLTKKGEKALDQLNTQYDLQLAQFTSGLKQKEIAELAKLLNALNDGMGAKEQVANKTLSPLRVALARLARGAGVIGKKIFHGSLMDPLSWHILEEIAERTSARSDPTTPGYLSSALSCPPTKISFALNALEKRGWINRAPHPQDRRSSLLTLTTEGEELLQEIRSQGAALVSRGFRALTDSDSKTLLKLFGHIAGDSSPGPEIVLQAKRSLRFATTHKERALLRRFAIENTYSTNQELEIPESLFSAESNNVALLENDELEACIEYTSSKNHLTIHSFAVHQGKETKLSDCLEAIITHETDATSPRPKQLEISTHLYSLTESKILIQKFGDRQAK